MKRVMMLLLVVSLLWSFAIPAFATVPNDTVVQPRYTYIKTHITNLTIDETTGIATSKASCYAVGGNTVEIECKLQRYNGSSWTTIKTWTASGTNYASVNKDWAVYSGYTYRVYAAYRIRSTAGNLLESTTSSKTCIYPTN